MYLDLTIECRACKRPIYVAAYLVPGDGVFALRRLDVAEQLAAAGADYRPAGDGAAYVVCADCARKGS